MACNRTLIFCVNFLPCIAETTRIAAIALSLPTSLLICLVAYDSMAPHPQGRQGCLGSL